LALEVCECQEDDVPTYQYACTECGHQLEAVQSFTDEPLTECPVCSGRLRKRFSSVGVVFKGSGFYRNDSRDSASGGAAAKDGSAKNGSGASGSDSGSGKNGSSGETKSESKTDSKTDSKPAAPASTSSTSST
jgi:putative FmdB family regulatory protein